jgi:hypothetical protein
VSQPVTIIIVTIFVIFVLIAVGLLLFSFITKHHKEESLSYTLVTSGLALIDGSFGSLSDKIFAFLRNTPDGVNWIELIVGFILVGCGLYGRQYVKNKLYILNINGYYSKRIEDYRTDLGLNPFEFKEKEIDFIRLYHKGVENTFQDISEEITENIRVFKEQSWGIKRAYTGIAPIPFIMLAGRRFGRETMHQYFEFNKTTGTYYRLKKSKFAKYPHLQLHASTDAVTSANEVVLAVSVTSRITQADTAQFACPVVDLSLETPMDNVIQHEKQLEEYCQRVYEELIKLSRDCPNLQRIHLLYSGQSCLAFKLATMMDDTRMVEVISYQYERQGTRRYPWGIVVSGSRLGNLIR